MGSGENDFSKQDSSFGTVNQKKPSKMYSAWLAWWRSTVSSDDFYKYIFTKVSPRKFTSSGLLNYQLNLIRIEVALKSYLSFFRTKIQLVMLAWPE